LEGRRSEKLERQIEQLELQLDELLLAQAPLLSAPQSASGNARKPVRKPLPSHLPRVLFAGSDTGGASAAAMYSLIGTAKINGVDPESWLRHVLTHIADHPVNRVDGFLAWHFTDPASSLDPLVR
jgi:hypothetical protein